MNTLNPNLLRCAVPDCWLPPDRMYGKPTLYCPRHQRIFGAVRTLRQEGIPAGEMLPWIADRAADLPRRR